MSSIELSDRIKQIRNMLHLEQSDLAIKLGTNASRISNLERGILKKLNIDEVESIVAMGINRNWLMTGFGDILAPAHQVGRYGDLSSNDLAQLQTIIELLEEDLIARGRTMPPEAKAKLIIEIYLHSKEIDNAEEEVIKNSVKMGLRLVK